MTVYCRCLFVKYVTNLQCIKSVETCLGFAILAALQIIILGDPDPLKHSGVNEEKRKNSQARYLNQPTSKGDHTTKTSVKTKQLKNVTIYRHRLENWTTGYEHTATQAYIGQKGRQTDKYTEIDTDRPIGRHTERHKKRQEETGQQRGEGGETDRRGEDRQRTSSQACRQTNLNRRRKTQMHIAAGRGGGSGRGEKKSHATTKEDRLRDNKRLPPEKFPPEESEWNMKERHESQKQGQPRPEKTRIPLRVQALRPSSVHMSTKPRREAIAENKSETRRYSSAWGVDLFCKEKSSLSADLYPLTRPSDPAVLAHVPKGK